MASRSAELSSDDVSGRLAEKAAGGDRSAFERLIDAEYDFVFSICFKWLRNREDAEDAAQDVCIRLGAAISRFKGTGRFRTWLYAVVLNAVRDRTRKAGRESANAKAWRSDPTATASQDGDGNEPLWRAVALLPDKQKDSILLVYGEGMTHARAAEVMGVAEATASWHVHEARKRLKTLMAREDADA